MINKGGKNMSLHTECSNALHILEHVQQSIHKTEDPKLQAQTAEDLNMLISVFSNPILRSIVCVEDSLRELNQQLQEHPSILPVDLHVTPAGELSLSVPPADDIFDSHFVANQEFEDQRVPVAKLSHGSSTETSTSPQLGSTNGTLAPITTQSYAIEFQKAIEEASHGREVLNIQLLKPDGASLGFSLVGLHSEGKGDVGIYVNEIQASGIAARDGSLREGDQILAIDGQPLDSAISNQQAINILQQARGRVELVVARGEDRPGSPVARSPSAVSDVSKAGSDMVLNTEWAQVELIDLVNDGSGLGFGIIGGRSTGVVVKTILPGGVADRDGRLQSGDHILQIGDVNLRGMGSEQVAAVLRQSGSHVRLVVARPVETADYQALGSRAPIVPTKILADTEELDRRLMQMGYTQGPVLDGYSDHFIPRDHDPELDLLPEACLILDGVGSGLISGMTAPSLPILTMDMIPIEPSALPEMETFSVELKKDVHGLGITIAGYVCEKEELSGIFVKSVSEGSAADLCGRILVNDRIIEVDGQSLHGYTNHQAVEVSDHMVCGGSHKYEQATNYVTEYQVLRATGQIVKLKLERYLRGPKFEQLQQAIAASELKPPTPSSPSAASLPRFPVSADGESAIEIEVEGESHTTMDSVILEPEEVAQYIDDDYDGVLKPAVEAAIQSKWAKVLGPDSEIIVAQLCKLSEGGGLGISLEGTVDVEHGQEVRPHHYIRSILPEGPVGRNARLRSGDELLEVNGHRLLGMNHIEVVSILKDLPMSVRMVCARRDGDFNPHLLIDTAQDKNAFAARNILGGSLQNLIPASDRLVKAKSDGSLASTATATDASFSKLKSRSLEPLTGLAMWSSEPQIIELVKGERGLGFSILDYQDPMNPNETVIVIRSLVPGGVAQMDGRLIPGDRLLSVNDTNLENASLDQAVQALKGAPKGVVRIGVAKPLPIPDSVSQEDVTNNTPTVDDQSMFSSCESLSATAEKTEEDDGGEKVLEEAVEVESEAEDSKAEDEDPNAEEGEEPLMSFGLLDNTPPVIFNAPPSVDSQLAKEDDNDDADELGESDDALVDSDGDLLELGPTPEDESGVVPSDFISNLILGRSVDEELDRSLDLDGELSGDLLKLMIPVSSERMSTTQRTPSTGDITEDDLEEEESPAAWGKDVIHLPHSLEVTIKIHKGNEPLGISVDSVERGMNGMLVVLVVPGGAVARDGRIRPSDYLISVNHESLRNATNSKTRAILRRTQLLSTDISITYVPGEAAAAYRKSVQNEPLTPPVASVRRTSPRSPYIPSDSSFDSSSAEDRDRESSQTQKSSSVLTTHSEVTTVVEKPEESPDSPFPSSQIPSPLNEEGIPHSDAPSPEHAFTSGPQSVCVVDGLYSVRSPKGNKILVGVELSPRISVPPIPSPRRTSPLEGRIVVSRENIGEDVVTTVVSRELEGKSEVVTTVVSRDVEGKSELVSTQIKRTYSFERDYEEPISVLSDSECRCTCPSPSADNLNAQLHEDSELITAHSGGASSEDDFKSGITSPFYSPTVDSPEMTISKSSKMDKESSANILLAKHWGPERVVEVTREANTVSLGISIVGGKVDLYNSGPDSSAAILGIFIKNVLPNSPAGKLGELKTGDRILEVDSTDLRNASHERAVDVIRRAGTKVRFLVQSLIQWNMDGREERPPSVNSEIALDPPETPLKGDIVKTVPPRVELARTPSPELIQQGRKPSLVKKVSDEKPATSKALLPPNGDDEEEEESDDDTEYRDLEGMTRSSKGFEIYRASAGNVRRSKDEEAADPEEVDDFGYTTNKVKKKYGNLGNAVLVFQLERNHKGLGISLAGHKDRNKMAVYVCGLNPHGTAFKAGGLQVGDEILEVNGVVLQGRCHLNASAIIKGIPGPIFKVIVHRRSSALEELAVKPITQFPVTLDDETPEQKYAKFKGVKTVTIKKGNQGLGIMIIEGKHAEVGQGIFISDIQEGSAAEQAGLVVGDMILAVNSDTLLGANYDTSASLLKKTEGVVSLVVCNPNKTKEEEAPISAGAGGLEVKAATPARSPSPVQPKEEKRLLIKPFSSLPPPKSPTPLKSNLRVTDGPGPVSAVTPKTSPALSVRFSGVVGAEEPPPDPATCPVVPGKETHLEFNKEKGLGLCVVGGSDTPLGCVLIHDIHPDGAAGKDGRLQIGDQILEFDGDDFRKVTHTKAIQIFRHCHQKVKMLVYREESSGKDEDLYQVIEVDLMKKPGKGLGLSLIGRKGRPGVYISEILHGGVAETDSRLMKGDFVLAVNGQDLKSASQEAAAAVLKTASGKVLIKIGRLKPGKPPSASNGKTDPDVPRTVTLEKDIGGLGFSIVGGYGSSLGDLPIYVKTIFKEGSAAKSGELRSGDRIVAVDDTRLDGLSHDQAASLLRRAPGPVRLRVFP